MHKTSISELHGILFERSKHLITFIKKAYKLYVLCGWQSGSGWFQGCQDVSRWSLESCCQGVAMSC